MNIANFGGLESMFHTMLWIGSSCFVRHWHTNLLALWSHGKGMSRDLNDSVDDFRGTQTYQSMVTICSGTLVGYLHVALNRHRILPSKTYHHIASFHVDNCMLNCSRVCVKSKPDNLLSLYMSFGLCRPTLCHSGWWITWDTLFW